MRMTYRFSESNSKGSFMVRAKLAWLTRRLGLGVTAGAIGFIAMFAATAAADQFGPSDDHCQSTAPPVLARPITASIPIAGRESSMPQRCGTLPITQWTTSQARHRCPSRRRAATEIPMSCGTPSDSLTTASHCASTRAALREAGSASRQRSSSTQAPSTVPAIRGVLEMSCHVTKSGTVVPFGMTRLGTQTAWTFRTIRQVKNAHYDAHHQDHLNTN
jgi:hypothetical protein